VLEGLLNALSLTNILLALGGVVAGVLVGSLPGLTATMAVAVLVPVTFSMPAAAALILMGAIYTGAIYGGAYSAILLNTPGTPSAIATTFDGYPMAKKGKGDLAVTLSCFSSVFGGIVGALALLFLSPPLAEAALAFGPAEYFWLAILGLSLVSALSADDFLKGVIGACFGLLLAVVGVAEISADVRLTFGSQTLLGGIEIVSALIGLYCLPVLMDLASRPGRHLDKPPPSKQYNLGEAWLITLKGKWNLIRSSVIGTLVGILPGAGGSIAGLVAYSESRRNSKNPENYGTGEPAGVQAVESANNATVGGGLIPTLVLGIPGTPPDAVILGALLIQGIRTGPELFTAPGSVAYTFIWGLLLATLLMLPAGLVIGRRAYRFVAAVPSTILVPLIGFLTMIGAFAIRNSISDIVLMILLGCAGRILIYLRFSVSPVVLGLILSSIAEQGFVQTWTIGAATKSLWSTFFGAPLSMAIIFLTGITFIAGFKGRKGAAVIARQGMDKKSMIAAAVFLIASAVALVDATNYTDRDSLVFPNTVAIAMAFFSFLLLVRSFVRPREEPAAEKSGSILRSAGVAASMLAAAGMMHWVGFYVAAAFAMTALTLVANFDQWTGRRAAGYILCLGGVSSALSVLFVKAFLIPLPVGSWFQ